MFKKTLLLLVVLIPIIYIYFVGYPIISDQEYAKRNNNVNVNYSKRCYQVNDLNQYLRCLKTSDRLKGNELLNVVNKEISSLNSVYSIIFFSAFVIQIICLSIIILTL